MAVATDSILTSARPLLPFVQRRATPVDDPRTAVEILDDICREVERQGISGQSAPKLPADPEPVLPAWAPLPSLPMAFSRRAALFGAVTATGFLGAATLAGCTTDHQIDTVLLPAKVATADARLVDLSADLEILAVRMDLELRDDERDSDLATAIVHQVDACAKELAAARAHSLDGLGAKVRALTNVTLPWQDLSNSTLIIDSIAADIARLQAEQRNE